MSTKLLFIPHGFIGDRLLTTSAMAVTKRLYPDVETHFFLSPEFGFMDEVILATGVVDGLVRDEKEIDGRWDSVLQMPHCRFDTNPVRVYCESFIENLPMNTDLTPAFIDVSKLSVSSMFQTPTRPYLSYQVDWQNRTSTNVSLVRDLLVRRGLSLRAVGSDQPQHNSARVGTDEFTFQENARRHLLNETMKIISGAELHLCMNGGTAMFAGYVKTRSAMTTDWFYIRHNEQQLDPLAYLNWLKQTPRDMSGDLMHHMFHPLITEEELVSEVVNMLRWKEQLELPPNFVQYPELIDYFRTNSSIPPFKV